jgi:2-methylisocitrate lyase-like PEP mutase family enzyme
MNQATTFRALHAGARLLVLPNAWDAASARLVQECGAAAIATSSAAVSWAHGRADGEQLDTATVLQAVREITRVVDLPVTVDVESGYAAEPEAIADFIAALVDTGAVGINLEDGVGTAEVLAAKIAVVKRVAARAGRDLFVNARTDVYLRGLAQADAAVAETLRRARLYREAGADGLFVPRLTEADAIRTITGEVQLPLNVVLVPGLAPVGELHAWGVRRLSIGCALAQASLAFARKATRQLLDGNYAPFADLIPTAELNGWFQR